MGVVIEAMTRVQFEPAVYISQEEEFLILLVMSVIAVCIIYNICQYLSRERDRVIDESRRTDEEIRRRVERGRRMYEEFRRIIEDSRLDEQSLRRDEELQHQIRSQTQEFRRRNEETRRYLLGLTERGAVAGDDHELGLGSAEGLQGGLVAHGELARLDHKLEAGVDGLLGLLRLLGGHHCCLLPWS